MRLWGVDSTGFRVPDEVWFGDDFGIHENHHADVPSAGLICQFDLLNQVTVGLYFYKRSVGERIVVQRILYGLSKDVCAVYNRGFASQTGQLITGEIEVILPTLLEPVKGFMIEREQAN
jgi:hypothetical protein